MSSDDLVFRSVLLGEDTLAIQCAEILARRGLPIVAIVTAAPRFEAWARERAIPVFASPESLVESSPASRSIDYLFSITNLKILREPVLELATRAAINFHDGPLPCYAGMYTPAWALLNGESEYGIRFHAIEGGIDEGPIYAERNFPIASDETSLTLNTKCFEAGIEAFAELVEGLVAGNVTPRSQDLSQRSYFGRDKRPELGGVLDWSRPTHELDSLVRALFFGPYDNPLGAAKLWHPTRCYSVSQASPAMGVAVADAERSNSGSTPGTILEINEQRWTIATGDGALEVQSLQTLEGLPVSLTEAAAALELSVGDSLSTPLAQEIAPFEGGFEATAPSERRWSRALARLVPAELPHVRIESPPGQAPAAAPIRVPFSIRASTVSGPTQDTDERSDARFVLAAAYLARLSTNRSFDLAIPADGAEPSTNGSDPNLLWSPWKPWRVDASRDGITRADFIEVTTRSLRNARDRKPFLKDLIGRMPALTRHDRLRKGLGPTIAIEASPRPGPVRVSPGSEVCIRFDPASEGGEIEVDASVYEAETARSLAEGFEAFAEAWFAATSDAPLAMLPILKEEERQKILEGWNQTASPIDERNACVHQLIEARANAAPDAIALRDRGRVMTYSELDRRAEAVASVLRKRGLGPDHLVGVYLERSIEMIIAVFGIHKAGAAYVPMDPAYPRDRIAWMLEDSRAPVVLTNSALAASLPTCDAETLDIDIASAPPPSTSASTTASNVSPENLAYVIYTSGSTGKPKGVLVEHRNVVSFFAGIDQHIEHDRPGRWLAVTSLSFDIAVLELLWTLSRGFEVVLYADPLAVPSAAGRKAPARSIDFGLYLWGADDRQGSGKYDLMLAAARFGDEHGFNSIWTPERHFHAFGGPYPNPSVTGAAIASVTDRIEIRGGSCVLPLHHPIRVAEEWSVVDNLSNGRVGVSFAAGWQPNDFVIAPDRFKDSKANMFSDIDVVRRLWRGEAVDFTNPLGDAVPVTTQPRPIQSELPVWVTTAGSIDTFRQAGEVGANLLTHLLGQSTEELSKKISVYREARRAAGFDPATGKVSLMLHTLVGADDDSVREHAREPMKEYLRSSVMLLKGFAWAFPAFTKPGGNEKPDEIDLESLSHEELDAVLEFAFDRYFKTSGLFGSIETCGAMIERVRAIGVDEIACLIDYGVPNEIVIDGLDWLGQLKNVTAQPAASAPLVKVESVPAAHDEVPSIGEQIERHAVTHMQCTPSMARMILNDPDCHAGLARLEHLMLGGEACPASLVRELAPVLNGRLTNLYGPTETTIWSAAAEIEGTPAAIPIGRPIANTRVYVVDANLQPVPAGVPGELLIGGPGVTRGYHERPDLTQERFVPDPHGQTGDRLYRTGDLVRFDSGGVLEFLGRLDHQVKIRGHRIELGEIEARLDAIDGIRESVAIVQEKSAGDQRLVAFVVPSAVEAESASTKKIDPKALRAQLADSLPDFMVPGAIRILDAFPLTPNGKIDRLALPSFDSNTRTEPRERVAPSSQIEKQVAQIWRDVLGRNEVGIHDNFFDLGGHSLLVIQIHRSLREALDQPVTLTDLYRFPTIAQLVAHLSGGTAHPEAAVDQPESAVSRARARAAMRRRRSRSGNSENS